MIGRERDHGDRQKAGEPSAPLDDDLLVQLQTKDEAALTALYDRYSGLVYTLALRIVGDCELAEEVLQDTFWRCWQGAEGYDANRGRVAGWLMGIARNRAIDLWRSRQHQARLREQDALPLSGSHGEPGRPDETDQVALHLVVSGALDSLSRPQREVIELAYYRGLTQAEIADTLAQPLGTVKTRMRAALGRMRTTLWPLPESESDGHGRAATGQAATRRG